MTDWQALTTAVYFTKKKNSACKQCNRKANITCPHCTPLIDGIRAKFNHASVDTSKQDDQQLLRLLFDTLGLYHLPLSIFVINKFKNLIHRQESNSYRALVKRALESSKDGRLLIELDNIRFIPVTLLKSLMQDEAILDETRLYTASEGRFLSRLKDDKTQGDNAWYSLCCNIAHHCAINTLTLLTDEDVLTTDDCRDIQKAIKKPQYMHTPCEWRYMTLHLIECGVPVTEWEPHHLYHYLFVGRGGSVLSPINDNNIIERLLTITSKEKYATAYSDALCYLAIDLFKHTPLHLLHNLPSWQHTVPTTMLTAL